MRLYIKVNQSESKDPCGAIMLCDWGSAVVFSDSLTVGILWCTPKSLCTNFLRISGGSVRATFGQKDQVTIKFVQDLEQLQRNRNKK
jgi:hypothetical protein